eukprot:Polyplicarium_translucidae@DN3188_c0_g1_i2.p1
MKGMSTGSGLTQILLQTQSADLETRRGAEQRLNAVEQSNFSQYLSALADELCNEDRPEVSRQLAGLTLKNAVSGQDVAIDKEKRTKWLALPEEVSTPIRKQVLEALKSGNEAARNTACQVVAKLGRLMLPISQWPDLLPYLLSLIRSDHVQHQTAALRSLGYLCEDVDALMAETNHELFNDDISNSILTSIVAGMQIQEPAVKLAALKAFYHALLFARSNFERENERGFIFKVVLDNIPSTDARIAQAAWECVLQIANEYYEYLGSHISEIGQLSFAAIAAGVDVTAIPAMEFWNTLCDEEIAILQEQSLKTMQSFIEKAADFLLPILFEAMTKQDKEIHEPDDWTLSMAAGTCLGLCAQLLRDAVLPRTLDFVNRNFANPDWKHRDAAVFAYGSIMEGPSSAKLAPLVAKSFPLLCQSLCDASSPVRDTTAWTIGRIAQFHTPCIVGLLGAPDSPEPGLIGLLLERLKDEPRVAVQICYALNELSGNVGGAVFEVSQERPVTPLDPWFAAVSKALVDIVQRADADENNLRTAAYAALSSLILNIGGWEAIPVMESIMQQLGEWLEQTLNLAPPISEDVQQIQASLCGCLAVLFIRLGDRCKGVLDRMFALLARMLEQGMSPGIQTLACEEALSAVSALSRAAKEEFERHLIPFAKILHVGLTNHEDVAFCSRCIEIVGDVSRSLGPAVHPACDPLVRELYRLLHGRDVKPALKSKVLFTVGDVAMNIGPRFEGYLSPFLELLARAAQTKIDEGPTENEDWVDYIRQLRDGVLAAYSGILYGLRDGQKLQVRCQRESR